MDRHAQLVLSYWLFGPWVQSFYRFGRYVHLVEY
jgi:hypothetical protein